MREIRHDIERWFDEGHGVALAQVIKTWGSSPRAAGSLLAVSDDARLAGSVSGGCIEGAVAQSALACLEDGAGVVEKFHASTQRAQEVGLSCGGNVDVLVTPLDRALFEVESALVAADREYLRVTLASTGTGGIDAREADSGYAEGVEGEPMVAAVDIDHADAIAGASLRTLGSVDARAIGASFLVAFSPDAEAALEAAGERCDVARLSLADVPGDTACCVVADRITLAARGLGGDELLDVACEALGRPRTQGTGQIERAGHEWFYARCAAMPQLVCIGGTHVSIHLAQMAKMLGYRTVVIDPRGVFATEERFPFVDELVHEWPQEAFRHIELTSQTALCALTHDPKIDVPALARALESRAFYIGSLGRTTTQLSRCEELRGLGYPEESIARISGPIGLDLRGREPAEIALSIMAEITAVRYGAPVTTSTMLASARKAAADLMARPVAPASCLLRP